MESASTRSALTSAKSVAVIGGGWAGLAAAIGATQQGHCVTLFEASRQWGGRARTLKTLLENVPVLDNGQHILIGGYQQTLQLMQTVGVNLEKALWRLPLNLSYPDASGLLLSAQPFPLNLILGIAKAKGWRVSDKWSLLKTAWHWQRMQFECAQDLSVADLCKKLSPLIWQDLIEPLCVSALNTPAKEASGAVFLRVLKDALFGVTGSSDLLLPRLDLGEIFPHAAVQWLSQHGAVCRSGVRIEKLEYLYEESKWQIADAQFDRVVVATPAWDAAHLIDPLNSEWAQTSRQMRHEAIATVYIQAHAHFQLPQPMLALRADANAPAQFVFDRGQIEADAKTPGLLAFVASALKDDKAQLEVKVLKQAQELLRSLKPSHAEGASLKIVQTVIEKRATFACTPNLKRPSSRPLEPEDGFSSAQPPQIQYKADPKSLTVCGDYVAGPYPATLEGAVISGLHSVSSFGAKG